MSKKAGNLRWSKFWWQDWQRDPALRCCSPAARGVWMDMLCMAHEGAPYGHVTLNGKPPTMRQLASVFGISVEQATDLIQELEDAGVFSRRGSLDPDDKVSGIIGWLEAKGHFKPCVDGVIFSRRMVRDIAAHIRGKETGSTGGNPDITGRDTAPPDDPPPPSREGEGLTPPVSPQEAKRLLEEEKEEPLLRNGADAPDAKAKQTTFLPPDPKPPSPPGRDELWFEGVPTFARLTGQPMETKAERKRVTSEIGRLVKESGDDYLRVLKAIRDADAQKPIAPDDWIWAAIRRGPRLIVNNAPSDPDDLYGVNAWCASLPGVKPSEESDRPRGKWDYGGRLVDFTAKQIATAARFSDAWRGSWDMLREWIDAGIPTATIVASVGKCVANWDDYDPKRIASLSAFDAWVRPKSRNVA